MKTVEQVPSMWKQLCSDLNILKEDPWLIQSVVRFVFENLLTEYFRCKQVNPPGPRIDGEEKQFSRDELNALRYACGYVAQKILKKYENRKSKKADEFEMCLGQMAVAGDVTDFTMYSDVTSASIFFLLIIKSKSGTHTDQLSLVQQTDSTFHTVI